MDWPDGYEIAQLVGELELGGRPLQVPNLTTDRSHRTVTTVPPVSFIAIKDPRLQQQRTSVEDVAAPRGASCLMVGSKIGTSFARVIHGVLDPNECAELLAQANEIGFGPLDNRFRCMFDCPDLATYLLEVMRPHLPERLCRGKECLEELNPRFRVSFYTPGQEFEPHCDTCYTYPEQHPKHGQVSRITVLLYLHDVPDANGGATNFVGKDRVACQPRGGSALIFTQDLRHEGAMVTNGIKYFIRSELMYMENQEEKELQELIDDI